MSKLLPQSQLAVELPVSFVATDVIVPSTFIVGERDLAMPVEVQELLVAAVPGMRSERIDAGHSPFLSHPDELAQLVASVAMRATHSWLSQKCQRVWHKTKRRLCRVGE